jgi:hypothetical protein
MTLNEFLRVTKLRNFIFNSVSYYIKIQNKWKDWLRNKHKTKSKFEKKLEYAYCKLIKMPEFFPKELAQVAHHFSQQCKDDIFELFFNEHLMKYLKDRLEYMADRAMLVDLGLYFDDSQHQPSFNPQDESIAHEIKRKQNLLLHKGMAMALYRAWLLYKTPAKVHLKTSILRKKIIDSPQELNPLPMSLVKIRNFPTTRTFIETHHRYEMFRQIKLNYKTHKYEAVAYRMGDLDVTSVLSPRRTKVSRNHDEMSDEKAQIEAIRKAAQKSVGIRRIMALLSRDYSEKLTVEFSNELLITVIMSALDYYKEKYARSHAGL